MKIDSVSSNFMPIGQPKGVTNGNQPVSKESPVEGTKPTQSGQPMDGCGNSLSTKDMVQLVMAVKMMEKLNEITSDIIEKYLK
tara:strand:- start:775 stop:1023 length:249 start_codon:yes stop_codon:yes gene_type:complete